MQKVLRKRIFRDFKENLPRYLALAFLLILSMYMVVSVVGAAETVMRGTTTEAEKQNVEDGQFSLFVPMKESEWDALTDKGITLEKMFFLDYAVDGDKTIRVFRNRTEINTIAICAGKLAQADDELVLERQYAEKNAIHVGDTIVLGDRTYKVSGIGTVPDYDSPLKSLSDTSCDSLNFGLAFVTGLEREKIEAEYAELMDRIAELKAILADEKKLLGVIREEILLIAEKYGDERRTSIGFDEYDISMEDLIPVTNTVIAMTKLGYIKRMSLDNFRAQNRGGKGIKGMETIDEDYIEELLMTTSHHYMMFFTNTGRVYRMKAYEIPEAGRTARGTAIINLLQLQPGEKITAVIPIKEYTEGHYLFMATKNGIVKKTPITDYANVRKTGLAAITLREDDELIEVKKTDNEQDIFLVTKYGQCIRFNERDVRSTGRTSMGVIGMNLTDGDKVVGMQMESQGDALMIVSEKGLGKCTLMSEFSPQNRGGKGVKCYKITEKTGNIIGVKAVNQDNEIMLITTEGIIIRIPVNGTALLGRVTSGVKLINVNDGVTVASMAKVKEDKSIMENDIPEPKQPEGVIVEEDEDASASEEELISKELGELINRAEQDSEEE